MLEQQANVFKNYAFFATERLLVPGNRNSIQLVDPVKWATMCPTKQVARLRAAAGLPSYLNSFDVRTYTPSVSRAETLTFKTSRHSDSSKKTTHVYGTSGCPGTTAIYN